MKPVRASSNPAPRPAGTRARVSELWSRVTPNRALALVLALAAIVILWSGRGIVFIADEWGWISDALHVTPNAILRDYYGHLFALTFGIYDLLTAIIGLAHYWVFRVVALSLHLTVALLVFLLVRRSIGPWLALAPAAVVAFLGAGADAFVSAINIGLLGATAACLAALLALVRRTPRGDLATCVLLVFGLASFTTAVAFTAGVLVEVLWGRDRWRRIWVPLVPTLLYIVWRLRWGAALSDVGGGHASPDVVDVLRNGVKAAAGAVAGLSGVQLENFTLRTHVPWLAQVFQVVAVASAALLVYLVVRFRRVSARLANLVVVALGIWLLIAVGRGAQGDLYASRYVYSGTIITLLIMSEAVSVYGLPRPRLRPLIAAAAMTTIAFHVVWIVALSNHIREESTMVRARLAALDVIGSAAPASFQPSGGFAFRHITAGSYFAARRRFHSSPAYSTGELRRASAQARQAADDVLLRAFNLHLVPGGARAPGPPPAIDHIAGGRAAERGSCLLLTPVGAPVIAEIRPRSPSGIVLEPSAGAIPAVAARRFGDRYLVLPVAEGRGPASLATPAGSAPDPWHLRVASSGPTLVCSRS